MIRDPRKRSRQQERRAAKVHGGVVTKGSGNGWAAKNDVKTPTLSIEMKTTNAMSYRLTEDELLEAEKQALLDGRDALFAISFGRSGRNWVVMSEEDYLLMSAPCTKMHFRHITAEEEAENVW